MERTRAFLERVGLPRGDLYELPTSTKRFPDGAQYRVEIPSTEGPRVLAAVIEEARRYGIVVHRVSQGSGVMLLTDEEIREMGYLAAANGMEVSLFARPSAGWDVGGMARASAGAIVSAKLRGQEQLVHCLEDVRRAAERGIRSVLLADEGALWIAGEMRRAGELPQDMQFKVSVLMGAANPASVKLLVQLGADTYNAVTDLALPQLAAIRAAVDIPLDVYVEVPDDVGGFVRQYEIAELVRICAPIYLKFGLRHAPNIYPSGRHLEDLAVQLGRERVRRAAIGLMMLHRYYPDAVGSRPGAAGLAVPVVEA
ncbi:MAG: hypothetical protein ACK42I_04335 [Thermomicrobium sp.]